MFAKYLGVGGAGSSPLLNTPLMKTLQKTTGFLSIFCCKITQQIG